MKIKMNNQASSKTPLIEGGFLLHHFLKSSKIPLIEGGGFIKGGVFIIKEKVPKKKFLIIIHEKGFGKGLSNICLEAACCTK